MFTLNPYLTQLSEVKSFILIPILRIITSVNFLRPCAKYFRICHLCLADYREFTDHDNWISELNFETKSIGILFIPSSREAFLLITSIYTTRGLILFLDISFRK
jgi:hypothetical protein